MVRTFLKVYMELGSYFLFLQEQVKDIIIIINIHVMVTVTETVPAPPPPRASEPGSLELAGCQAGLCIHRMGGAPHVGTGG